MTKPIVAISFSGNTEQPLTSLDNLAANPKTAEAFIRGLCSNAFAAGFDSTQMSHWFWAGWRTGQKTWTGRQWSGMLPHLRDIARGWGMLSHSVAVGSWFSDAPGNFVDEAKCTLIDGSLEPHRLFIEQEWLAWASCMRAGSIVIDRGSEFRDHGASVALLLAHSGVSPILNGLPLEVSGKRADGSNVYRVTQSSFASLTTYSEEMKRIDPERALRCPAGQVCHVIVHPDIEESELSSLCHRGFTVGVFATSNIAGMQRVRLANGRA